MKYNYTFNISRSLSDYSIPNPPLKNTSPKDFGRSKRCQKMRRKKKRQK